MGMWINIQDEDDFYLLRSTLERTMDRRAGLLPEDVLKMYENVLSAMQHATKDIPPERPLQVEVGRDNPKPKKDRKERAPSGSITKIVHCEKHPSYGARYRPRTDCPDCWKAYERLNGKNPTAKAKVARKKR